MLVTRCCRAYCFGGINQEATPGFAPNDGKSFSVKLSGDRVARPALSSLERRRRRGKLLLGWDENSGGKAVQFRAVAAEDDDFAACNGRSGIVEDYEEKSLPQNSSTVGRPVCRNFI